ncbi:lipid-binding SYLF domain-containing protein [Desulfuromonas sp. KJ2020]|uniref:lipid-binding SYLF domain-containing protein n=1 Tax=Desulfuromonas sp. KJ2020 TaxID=2919173 RepID=UPI0020A735B0|nr:lipid-binding SYLF domain-containing protein [Desulfuromonas sp. KJ2020]MCP3176982.1 lipid-binding SYLF domain-containing protein [Desulfuromonas sp. KJ2020]
MKKLRLLRMLVALCFALLSVSVATAADEQTRKVEQAAEIMQQIMAIPEQAIPPQLLENSHGIAIIPSVIKVGFVFGGRYGKGVVLVRQEDGAWSNPCFVSLAGGSFGWQIGAQSTDVILVFKSRRSVEGMLKSKFTLGADASVAAGPVGRHVEGATDVELKAEIYSYSRSRGLFAGVSLEGSAITIDGESNAVFYGQTPILPRDILEKRLKAPAAATQLREIVARYAH